MLNAILSETAKPVRNAIATTVGVLVKHEFPKKDPWMNEVLKFIFENCSCDDPQRSEVSINFVISHHHLINHKQP